MNGPTQIPPDVPDSYVGAALAVVLIVLVGMVVGVYRFRRYLRDRATAHGFPVDPPLPPGD